MRLFIRLLLMPALVGWLLGGCSEKLEPKPTTYSQLLTGTTSKSWKMVSLAKIDAGTVYGPGTPAQFGIPTCIADDLLTFYANPERKFEASEGATKCTSTDPDIYVTDTWALLNANATLQFYLPVLNGIYPWTLKSLTSTSMTIQYYFSDIDASYQFTFNAVSTK